MMAQLATMFVGLLVALLASEGESRLTHLDQRTVNGNVPCDGTVEMDPGERWTIESPNYPSNYGPSSRCQYEISCAPEDSTYLEYICPVFELEDSTGCLHDRMKVTYRGSTTDYCGTQSPDGLVTSTGWTRVTFASNGNTNAKGFRCQVWCRQTTTTTTTTTPAPTTTTTTTSTTTTTTPEPTTVTTTPEPTTTTTTTTTTPEPTTVTTTPEPTTTTTTTTTPEPTTTTTQEPTTITTEEATSTSGTPNTDTTTVDC